MARAKRNKEQRQRDLLEILELRHEGWSERAIAAKLGLSQPVIHRDLQELDRLWLEATPTKVDVVKRRQLGAVDFALRHAWEDYRRSREPRVTITEQQEVIPLEAQRGELLPDGQTEVLSGGMQVVRRTVRTETGPGDPQWMKRIAELLTERSKILGLHTAQELQVNVRQYIEVEARKMGLDPDALMREIEEVAEEAWKSQQWGGRDGEA